MDNLKRIGGMRMRFHIPRKKTREAFGDPLVQVFVRICESMNMCIDAKRLSCLGAENAAIEKIARKLDVRYRQVTLSGEWWKADGGPMLAFLDGQDDPVALLPTAPGRYRVFRPLTGTEQPVDRALALRLNPCALMLYRPFRPGPVGVRDIAGFCLAGFVKKDFFMVILLGIAGGALGMAVPYITGILFDIIVPGRMRGQMAWMILILLASGFSSFAFSFTRSLAAMRVEGKTDMSLDSALWDRILKLPPSFFREYSSGDLAERSSGITGIRDILSGVALNTLLSGVFSVFSLGLVFTYDVRTGLAALMFAVVIFVLGGIFNKYMRMAYLERSAQNGKMQGLLFQIIRGIHKFIISGSEKVAFDLWHGRFSESKKLELRIGITAARMSAFLAAFPVVASITVFSVIRFKQPSMSSGSFMAMYAAFSSFLSAIAAMSDTLNSIQTIKPLYDRMRPLLETPLEAGDDKPGPGELKGGISLNHVFFRYPGSDRDVLEDISFQIKPGDMTAFVGSSGSGKSTMLRLMLGFEKPRSGNIVYDGMDLDKIDIREVRDQIGVVIQNASIMSDDIYKNIIGSSNHTIEEAWEAARQVSFDKDIEEMPMGMHTHINEGGSSLSGGQRQRLLIARALVKKPVILFLDEATSALDNVTQAAVSENLDRLKVTRIVIAHRLSTVKNADRILVFEKGRIVQNGTYEELIGQPGPFYYLARRQMS